MRKAIFILLLIVTNYLNAQINETQVDNIMLRIPDQLTYSTTDIAGYINQHFDTDRKKVRAVYTWVSSNIKYDTDSANNINLGPDPEAKIIAALRRRKGVCENYAAVFNDICIKCGLTSFVVDGYTKQGGAVDKTGHSWCAVFIEDQWLLCDPTWDESKGTSNWFLVQPAQMIETHMPFDPMWQLLQYPVSHKQFYSGNMYYDKNQALFNYTDTLAAYIKMDSLQRFRSTAFRIQQSGLYNNLVKNRHEYTKMNIEILREDKDVELYNSAVSDLNNSTGIYNEFVQYRNKQFNPPATDKDIQLMLAGIDIKLLNAHKKLDEIDKTEAVFKFSTEDLRNRLLSLANRVKEQKEFVKIYINTPAANRRELFYNQVSSAGK